MAYEEAKKIACNGRLKKENWDKREKIEGKLCLLLNALILTQILVTNGNFYNSASNSINKGSIWLLG